MLFKKRKKLFLKSSVFFFAFAFLLGIAAFYMAPPGFAQSYSTTGVELVKPSFSLAPSNPEFMEYLQNLKMGKVQQAGEQPLGYIPSPLDLSHMKGKTVLQQVGSFPATYDLRTLGKLTPVKDQGACGSCWSFATYASLESYLLPSETWDFSENNLKNTHGFDWGHSDGGNRTISAAYLARWSGPISESDDPYNPNSGVSPQGLSPKKHAQNIYFIPDRSGSLDNSNIKQAVMDYGALYTTFYWNSSYYNASNCAYYCGYENYGNHAVAIVGWDDNFDKNKFNTPAPGNGAFIIKNSWGTGWGQSGYFYLSYYDSNAGIENAAFNNAEPVTNYSKIYQYDPYGWIDSVGQSGGSNNTCFGANIFTASSSAPLSAASIYTASPNSTYELKVYKDVNDSSGPATGTLAGSKTGTITKPGYNTVKLDTPIPLTSGQKFSIVIKLTTPGYGYPLPVEYAWSGFDSNATSNPKESWVSLDGSTWDDLYDIGFGNACIKAFTGDSGPGITVASPNGSESWKVGSTHNITWNYSGSVGAAVKIELLKGGAVNSTITTSTSIGSGGSGSYSWTIPSGQAIGSDYKVRITSTTNSSYTDSSDNNFAINNNTDKKILFINDTGGSENSINDTSTNGYSIAAGIAAEKGFTVIEESNPTTITASILSNYDAVVFASYLNNREISQSEGDALAAYANNGGHLFLIGEWGSFWNNSFNKAGASLGITSNKDQVNDYNHCYDYTEYWPIISNLQVHPVTQGVGQFALICGSSLNVTSPAAVIARADQDASPSGAAVLAAADLGSGRVVAVADSNLIDNKYIGVYDNQILAENIFAWLAGGGGESASVTVTSPNGEENWAAGSTHNIGWNYTGNPGTSVKIELLKGGALNSTIAASAPIGTNGSGSYSWTIPAGQAAGSDYKVRITSTTNNSYTDSSDYNFTISVSQPKATIGFDPAEISVYKNPNDPYSSEFIVNVKIANLFSGQKVLSLHDIVSFDPEMLEAVKVETPAPSFLDPILFKDCTINNTNGTIDFSLARSSSENPGSGGVVYKITMKAKDKGTTLLKHTTVELRDENNQNLSVNTTEGTVNINSLIGDFTGDGNIDFNDLSIFALCWKHQVGDNGWDQKLDNVPGSPFKQADIGPAAGTPPNLVISADGKVDFNDLSVFAMMWNWVRNKSTCIAPAKGATLEKQSQTSVNFEPATITVKKAADKKSKQFTVSVRIDNMDSAQKLIAFHNIVNFDPEALEVVNVDVPAKSFLGPVLTAPVEYDNEAGTIDLCLARSDVTSLGKSGVVYNITMRAKKEGATSLEFDTADLRSGQNKSLKVGTGSCEIIIREFANIISPKGIFKQLK